MCRHRLCSSAYVCIVYSMTDDVGGNKGERERGGGEVEDEEKKRS